MKLEYITAILIQDRDFEKKNKLFLKIKDLETESQPLKKNYEHSATKYNEVLSSTTIKIGELFRKLEDIQLLIVKSMKNSLINSELFQSAYGAILVHETQKTLSFLNDIS